MAEHEWTVASALIERDGQLLMVRNVRRGGVHDWSTPGGVIDADDPSILDGLTREVEEETGLIVRAWAGLVYEVVAVAPDMGWRMRCEVHLATDVAGELCVEDPDGIVVEAGFHPPDRAEALLATCPLWVREPLGEWIAQRWMPTNDPHRQFAYSVQGTRLAELRVERQ